VSLREKSDSVAIRRFKGDIPIFIESDIFFETLDWTVEIMQCVDLDDMCLKAKYLLNKFDSIKESKK
jgi:hypothetical protein